MIRGLWIRDADLVDVHLLRTFVAVAECLSFSGAARRLGYTQSAVSQHIALLENDLGVTLLHRRPVGLTPAGERLLEHTGPILLRLDAARADVLRSVGEPPGELLLAASPLAVSERVAAVLALLRRARPGLEVTLVVTGREAVITGVATGDFPLGLVDGVAAPSDPLRLSGVDAVSAVAVAERPIRVVMPRAHPLAGREGLDLDDLSTARWIDAPDLSLPVRPGRASLRYTGTDLGGLTRLVAAGHGLAVLPQGATRDEGIAEVRLTSPRLVHRIELVHGSLGPLGTRLAAMLGTGSAATEA
jgi:DNA-binding transcriptional LysR family regulator